MKRTILFTTVLLFVASIAPHAAIAEMRFGDGLVLNGQLPEPIVSKKLVLLNVPHIRQKPWLCVPTSSAMILKYFGEEHDPQKLKTYAEGHKKKSKRNERFTYWVDMRYALNKIGKRWRIRDYPKTNSGFNNGLRDIKKSLRAGRPVMIDVHLGDGHTFVIIGFNDEDEVIYIRDPNVSKQRSRILSYAQLRQSWHNHRFGKSRSAFFSSRG